MVLLTGGEMVYLHGSCAVSPFTTSTVGATSTVTDAWQTVGKKTKKENWDFDLKSFILRLTNSDSAGQNPTDKVLEICFDLKKKTKKPSSDLSPSVCFHPDSRQMKCTVWILLKGQKHEIIFRGTWQRSGPCDRRNFWTFTPCLDCDAAGRSTNALKCAWTVGGKRGTWRGARWPLVRLVSQPQHSSGGARGSTMASVWISRASHQLRLCSGRARGWGEKAETGGRSGGRRAPPSPLMKSLQLTLNTVINPLRQ